MTKKPRTTETTPDAPAPTLGGAPLARLAVKYLRAGAVALVPIAELTPDPGNVRRHPERNLAALRDSLARFGQQRPIVVDAGGVVRAGNGTLEAARALGWEEIAVQVTALEGAALRAFAIADNRTAELAEWDDASLRVVLEELRVEGIPPFEIGFAPDDLAGLGIAAPADPVAPTPAGSSYAPQFGVIVVCAGEEEQRRVYERLAGEGLDVRVVVT